MNQKVNTPTNFEFEGSYIGQFGGQFVPQLLMPALQQLHNAFEASLMDDDFQTELKRLLKEYAGRPTPVTECTSYARINQSRIFLKREDLLHGGAHKTNQVLAQALLAKKWVSIELSLRPVLDSMA